MRSAGGVVALGVALCLLAAAFGVSSLYVPGVALVLLAAGAHTSVWAAQKRVRVAREPQTATLEEHTPLRLRMVLDLGRLPRPGAEVSLLPGAAFQPLQRGRADRIDFAVRLPRRGLQLVGPSTVRFRDPFGVFTRLRASPATEVLVLPRVERIGSGQLLRLAGLGHGARSSPSADLDALRPYRPGAPASRIHWPTVARTGELMERAQCTESERLPLVVLDAQRPASDESLDMAVRAAASLCVALASLGGCSLLLPGARRANALAPNLGSWPDLHRRLALVEPGAATAWAFTERAATVVWVTASALPRTPVGRRLGGTHYVVSPFALEGRAVLFAVAGCAVQAAGASSAARAA